MSQRQPDGGCVTGKVRYADDAEAAAALERVREARAARPDGLPPERAFYECRRGCGGWHLTSKPPRLGPEAPPKQDGETWEEYARRLERRVRAQRDQLEQMNALRADAGNRHERKRIELLQRALGRMTERWHHERESRLGLVRALREREPAKS